MPFFPFYPSFGSVFIQMFPFERITHFQGNATLRCTHVRGQRQTAYALLHQVPGPSIFEMSSISWIPGYTLMLDGAEESD